MAFTRSILFRILGLHLLAVLATAVLVPLTVGTMLATSAANLQHRTLATHAAAIARGLRHDPRSGWRLDLGQPLKTVYDNGFGGFSYAVVDARGALLFGGPPEQARELQASAREAAPVFFEKKRGSHTLYGGSFPQRTGAAAAWVIIAQDLEDPDIIVDDVIADFPGRAALVIAPLLVILFAIDIFIIRQALRPVVNVSAIARRIDPNSLDRRLPVRGLPREILPLAEAVNEALDRLAEGYLVQRDFTADAAHELRTPLAILRMQIDALPEGEQADRLRAGAEHMARIIGQLLEIAELDTIVSRPEAEADLRAVAQDAASDLSPLAIAHAKDMELTGETGPVWVMGSDALLYRAARNLIENAIKHTPPGTRITIEVDAGGVLRVIDDGQGISPEERHRIFRRFWRGERDHGGSAGLGLAIAQTAARNCGGSVSLEETGGHGASFALRLVPIRRRAQAG